MRIFLCLLLLASLAGCAASAESDPIVFRLAESQPPDYPTTVGDERFAELVEERTDGRIRIEVYDSGQLGQEAAVLEQVRLGAVDFTRTSASPLAEFDRPMGVYSLPYVFESEEHQWRFLNGPEGRELLDGLRSAGMVGLAYYDSGARNFYTKDPAVRAPEGLEGLKIRVQKSRLNVDVVSAFGASTTPMDFGEVYSALQTGIVDGAENNWPSYLSTSHYEVAPNFVLSGHARIPEVLLASSQAWDSLSPEDRRIVRRSAEDSVATQRESWDAAVREARRELEDADVNVVEIRDLAPWRERARSATEAYRDEYGGTLDAIEAAKP